MDTNPIWKRTLQLPIAVVTYMPCGAIFLGLTMWGCATVAGASISLSFVIKIAFLSVIVAIAAPPIPGSAFAVFPIIFSATGISMDYYSIAIIMGTVLKNKNAF